MSHQSNTEYLEDMAQSFDEERNGHLKAAIIEELKSKGFEADAMKLLEDWMTERRLFLEMNSVTERDVLWDEEVFSEYFVTEVDNGNPGEDGYKVDIKKQYIPIHLDVVRWMEKQ